MSKSILRVALIFSFLLGSGISTAQTLPSMPTLLEQQLTAAMLGTPAQVQLQMAALIADNPNFALAIAANGAASNPALAASFAGEAAKVVPAAELGDLYQAVGQAAPNASEADIAAQIRSNAPAGTDLAYLQASAALGVQRNSVYRRSVSVLSRFIGGQTLITTVDSSTGQYQRQKLRTSGRGGVFVVRDSQGRELTRRDVSEEDVLETARLLLVLYPELYNHNLFTASKETPLPTPTPYQA